MCRAVGGIDGDDDGGDEHAAGAGRDEHVVGAFEQGARRQVGGGHREIADDRAEGRNEHAGGHTFARSIGDDEHQAASGREEGVVEVSAHELGGRGGGKELEAIIVRERRGEECLNHGAGDALGLAVVRVRVQCRASCARVCGRRGGWTRRGVGELIRVTGEGTKRCRRATGDGAGELAEGIEHGSWGRVRGEVPARRRRASTVNMKARGGCPVHGGNVDRSDAAAGCVLGMAIGDALGLPFEGLSAARVARMRPVEAFRFFVGRGMTSDDTDHAELVARALARSGGNPATFERELAWGLRRWFAGLPPGIGLATARACMKLWCGIGAGRSGVFSAGNGPLMRAPVIGAAMEHWDAASGLIATSTRMTHTDPLALKWAAVVGRAAWHRARGASLFDALESVLAIDSIGQRVIDSVRAAAASAAQAQPTGAFAAELGCQKGVSGFVMHSGPIALHAAASHPQDLVGGCLAAVTCGGNTDTTAAIAGGIIGAGLGARKIRERHDELLGRLWDWPRGVARLEQVGFQAAAAVANGVRLNPPRAAFPLVAVRNLGQLILVLGHAVRRLAPPW